ncbi:hypothetical protein EES43_15210 [Streptomyces sp. ADI96-02]|uniref:hypothetical protein n=1 Tax=unclassified Streptomyces TaxID=2593676 RepID=UPI000F54C9F0|nr:hypothetical protein [Streptomyces sp. ADI96-02]RPK61716.1 hypothetical protein EES43_15210 [Streptomyces sp. ADI96-02]
MRKIVKVLAVTATAVPLVLGVAGLAAADSGPVFAGQYQSADRDGAESGSLLSGFLGGDRSGMRSDGGRDYRNDRDGDAGPVFAKSQKKAGPRGASSKLVASGFDRDGEAFFIESDRMAGPNGASSSQTAARS